MHGAGARRGWSRTRSVYQRHGRKDHRAGDWQSAACGPVMARHAATLLSALAKGSFLWQPVKEEYGGGFLFLKKDFLEKNSAVFNQTSSYSKSGTNSEKVKGIFMGMFSRHSSPPSPRRAGSAGGPMDAEKLITNRAESHPGAAPGAGLLRKRRGGWGVFSIYVSVGMGVAVVAVDEAHAQG